MNEYVYALLVVIFINVVSSQSCQSHLLVW